MAEHIVSADVNDAFLEAVMSLSDKLKYLQQEMPASDGSSLDIPPSETFAGRSLLPDLEKLKLKAITKARDYFLLQFQAIRKPKTNVQMVQQNSLCKYAPLLQFVQREAPSAAEDLRYDFISCRTFRTYCIINRRDIQVNIVEATADVSCLISLRMCTVQCVGWCGTHFKA